MSKRLNCIRTWQGWLKLAVVVDLSAGNVVGWSMKPTLSRELAIDALSMAVWRRMPKKPLLVHSAQVAIMVAMTGAAFAKPTMSNRA